MAGIITAVYVSTDTLPNVRDDLISTGVPQEKIRVDQEKKQVQVMGPKAGRGRDRGDPEATFTDRDPRGLIPERDLSAVAARIGQQPAAAAGSVSPG